MQAFYRHLREGLGVAAALRQAKQDWIAAAGDRAGDLFPWSAFVLVGDGAVTIEMRLARRTAAWLMLIAGALIVYVSTRNWRPRRQCGVASS